MFNLFVETEVNQNNVMKSRKLRARAFLYCRRMTDIDLTTIGWRGVTAGHDDDHGDFDDDEDDDDDDDDDDCAV